MYSGLWRRAVMLCLPLMKAARTPEMFVSYHDTSRRLNPEHHDLDIRCRRRRRENLNSRCDFIFIAWFGHEILKNLLGKL